MAEKRVGAMLPVMLDSLCTDCESWDKLVDRIRDSEELQAAFNEGLREQQEHDEAERCGYGPGQAIRQRLLEALESPTLDQP